MRRFAEAYLDPAFVQATLAQIPWRELLEQITRLLLELGNGFAYMGQQVHLEVGRQDYYLDLLFYHVRLRAYALFYFAGGTAGQQPCTGGTLQLATLAHQLPLRDMATIFTTIGPLARSQPTPELGILGYEFPRQYQVMINHPKGVIELR